MFHRFHRHRQTASDGLQPVKPYGGLKPAQHDYVVFT